MKCFVCRSQKKVSVFQNGSYFRSVWLRFVSFRSVPFCIAYAVYKNDNLYSNYHYNLLAFSCCSLKIARSIAPVHCRCVAASCRDWAPPSHPAMRTQRTRSQRYIAAHAAVLVTRAEKLSRRYLRVQVTVYCNTAAHVYTARYVRTYARAPKRSGTEWNGTNGTERITYVFNWERTNGTE